MLLWLVFAAGLVMLWTLFSMSSRMRWNHHVAIVALILGGWFAYTTRSASYEHVGAIGLSVSLLGLAGLIMIPPRSK